MQLTYNGKAYRLIEVADFTNRILPNTYKNYHEANVGETYSAEMSALAVTDEVNDGICRIFWVFDFEKGNEPELDTLDYNNVDRIL
jgi:hypothetical protein